MLWKVCSHTKILIACLSSYIYLSYDCCYIGRSLGISTYRQRLHIRGSAFATRHKIWVSMVTVSRNLVANTCATRIFEIFLQVQVCKLGISASSQVHLISDKIYGKYSFLNSLDLVSSFAIQSRRSKI